MTRPFRFGVLAPLRTDLPTWRDQVRRIADSGYSTLLMPDFPQLQPPPGPTLALVVQALPICGWAPGCMRPRCARLGALRGRRTRCRCSPRGASRWASARQARDRGTSYADAACPRSQTGSQWLAQVREVVTTLRDIDGPDLRTPVVMAVRGPKAQGWRPRSQTRSPSH